MMQNFWIGTDFQKLMASLPTGNDAVRRAMESQVKNLKALEEANQHAVDAFHAIFNQQNEILHRTFETMYSAMMNLSDGTDGAALSRQAEIAREATERTLDNLRQISETIAESSRQASQVLGNRMREGMAEMGDVSRP